MADNGGGVIDLTVDQDEGQDQRYSEPEEEEPIGVNICCDIVDLFDEEEDDEPTSHTEALGEDTKPRANPEKEQEESAKRKKRRKRLRPWSEQEPDSPQKGQSKVDAPVKKQKKRSKQRRSQDNKDGRCQTDVERLPQQQAGRLRTQQEAKSRPLGKLKIDAPMKKQKKRSKRKNSGDEKDTRRDQHRLVATGRCERDVEQIPQQQQQQPPQYQQQAGRLWGQQEPDSLEQGQSVEKQKNGGKHKLLVEDKKDAERDQRCTRRQRDVEPPPQQQTGSQNAVPRKRRTHKKRKKKRKNSIDHSSPDQVANNQKLLSNPTGAEKTCSVEVVDLLADESDDGDGYVDSIKRFSLNVDSRKQPPQESQFATATSLRHSTAKREPSFLHQQRAIDAPNYIVVDDDSDDSIIELTTVDKNGIFKDEIATPPDATGKPTKTFHSENEPKPFCQDRDYNYTFSREEASELQDRLLREAADRARSRFASSPSRSPSHHNPLDRPLLDIAERHSDHFRWKNPYARLGLPDQSSTALVKMHYRKLALLYHPDKSKYSDATDRFHGITSAYKKLV